MLSSRNADTPAKKMSKLNVEPAELARKLVKELEETKESRSGRAFVLNQYTVFLCREDYARFRGHLDQLVAKLQSHLEKHVHARGYGIAGALGVELTMDPELKPGYFGVLAERALPGAAPRPSSTPAAAGGGLWDEPEEDDYPSDGPMGGVSPRARSLSVPPLPGTPAPGAAMMGAAVPMPPLPGRSAPVPPLPASSLPTRPSYARPLSEQPASETAWPGRAEQAFDAQPQPQPPLQPPPSLQSPPQPQPPLQSPPQPPVQAQPVPSSRPPMAAGVGRVAEAAGAVPRNDTLQPDLANETIVLKVNNQRYEFPQGRVVLGRSRDADFRIDNADVSRRHAVIYWSEGSIVVKDLGSTNGTMVNGYPVDSTVVRPGDVIRVGDCHITAEPR